MQYDGIPKYVLTLETATDLPSLHLGQTYFGHLIIYVALKQCGKANWEWPDLVLHSLEWVEVGGGDIEVILCVVITPLSVPACVHSPLKCLLST